MNIQNDLILEIFVLTFESAYDDLQFKWIFSFKDIDKKGKQTFRILTS